MSFLRTIPRKALPLTRTRLFTTTSPAQKTPTEAAKDTLKSVDRTISDAAVKGIETGEKATEAIKQTTGMKSQEAKAKASESMPEMQGKASEVAGEAKGKAQEMAGEVKGKTSEMKGKAVGTKEEVKSKM